MNALEQTAHDRRPTRTRIAVAIRWGFVAIVVMCMLAAFQWWRGMAPRREAFRRLRALDRNWSVSFSASNADQQPERGAWWERLVAKTPLYDRCKVALPWILSADTAHGPPQMTDDDLAALTALTELKWLTIEDSQRLSPGGYACLTRLTRLQWLEIHAQPIDDSVLAMLGSLRELQGLNVERCPIDGSGFRDWPERPMLVSLDVRDTRFDDDALRLAADRFPNLDSLLCSGCPLFRTLAWEKNEAPPRFAKLTIFSSGTIDGLSPRQLMTHRRVEERFLELHPTVYVR